MEQTNKDLVASTNELRDSLDSLLGHIRGEEVIKVDCVDLSIYRYSYFLHLRPTIRYIQEKERIYI